MNILHINSNYLFTTLHEELIGNLKRYSIKHKIFMPVSEHAKFVVKSKNMVYTPISFKKNDRYIFFYKQKKILNSLNKTFNLDDYQLVHAHTLFTDGYAAYKLKKRYNIPYVVTVRNTDINVFFKKRFYLRKTGIEILKNATSIVFLSETYYNTVKKKYLPTELHYEIDKKVHIIPNGINSFWLDNKNEENKKKFKKKINLIYVGRIDKNKNIYTTVKACEILISKGYDVSLKVVGPIADEQEFKKWSNKSFIRYYCKQPREILINLYRQSDIFIMPSIYESFGLVYAEAMSQGLPIIYSENQGFDKQFKDGLVGYPVESLNEVDIVNKIFLINENYNYLSVNCKKLCEKFNWTNISTEYNLLYENSI